jgi:hypothetical protein
MTKAENAFETSVLNGHLPRLTAREDFAEFSRSGSYRLHIQDQRLACSFIMKMLWAE